MRQTDRALSGLRHFVHIMRTMVWSWQFIRPWMVSFVLCAVLSMLQNAWLSLTGSYLIGEATGHVMTGDFQAMLRTIGVVSLVAIVGILLMTLSGYVLQTIHQKGLGELRKALFAKLSDVSAADASNWMSGDLSMRISADADSAASLFSSAVLGNRSIFSMGVSILVEVVVSIVVLPVIGVPCILFLSFSIYANLACIRREYDAYQQKRSVQAVMTQHMVNAIAGSPVIRMFGLGKRQEAEYTSQTNEAYRCSMRAARLDGLRSSASSTIQWGAIIAVLIIGGLLVQKGVLELSTVTFVVLLQSQLNNDVLQLLNQYGGIQDAAAAASRVQEILNQQEEALRENAAEPELSADAVRLSHVSVSYPGSGLALSDISLRVQNGETLAIAGGSGGGKTTLVKSLLEFVVPDEGVIQLYGHDLQEYSQRTVRGLIAYVPQNCYLFDGSIRENILWGCPNAGEEQLHRAVHDAGLDEVVQSLPQGLDTRVGERGAQLSGGQRQRIAIARAFLKDAPLLLLDEATSALDGESERAVQTALNTLMEHRTCIVIAHRLSTIQQADRILVMEGGRIVELGSHEELMSCEGRYAQLYAMQYGGT